jgi:hypothetical protein
MQALHSVAYYQKSTPCVPFAVQFRLPCWQNSESISESPAEANAGISYCNLLLKYYDARAMSRLIFKVYALSALRFSSSSIKVIPNAQKP